MTLSLTKQETVFGWFYLGLELLILPVVLGTLGMLAGITSAAALNLIYYTLNALCCGWIFRRLLGQSLKTCRANPKALISATALGFLAYYAAALVVGILIRMVKPDFANVNDANVNGMIVQYPLLMFFAIVVLVPIAEESLFRGLIFVPLARRSAPAAYGVTCLAFAAVHVVGYIGSYDGLTLGLCFLQYLAPGAVLCWACKTADSLCAPMLIHALINAAAFLLTR